MLRYCVPGLGPTITSLPLVVRCFEALSLHI